MPCCSHREISLRVVITYVLLKANVSYNVALVVDCFPFGFPPIYIVSIQLVQIGTKPLIDLTSDDGWFFTHIRHNLGCHHTR